MGILNLICGVLARDITRLDMSQNSSHDLGRHQNVYWIASQDDEVAAEDEDEEVYAAAEENVKILEESRRETSKVLKEIQSDWASQGSNSMKGLIQPWKPLNSLIHSCSVNKYMLYKVTYWLSNRFPKGHAAPKKS